MHKISEEKKHNETETLNKPGPSSFDPSVHQCRALLPSGRLCPRKDLKKCPFHGEIIPRDIEGLPIDEALRLAEIDARFQREANEWKDPKYLKELSKQTGKDLEGKQNKNKRKKYPNLIDLKELDNTPRKRIKKRIQSKRIREKVYDDLNQMDEHNHQQYSDQWNYALNR